MVARSYARRGLSWTNELSRMKADRTSRPTIREERLRVVPGAAFGLSAWRGQSGKRYVVQVLTLDEADVLDWPGSVIIGVRRGADGRAVIIGCGHAGTLAEAVEICRRDRGTEIHLYRLADTAAERDAAVEDLVGDDAA